jgi:hypothetical protein
LKRILFSEEVKADIRAIPRHIAMNILSAIHRLAETGSGPVKMLKGEKARCVSASAITACGTRKAAMRLFGSTPLKTAKTPTAAERVHHRSRYFIVLAIH